MSVTLVTGGLGFIGSHYVEREFQYAQDGRDQIILLDNYTYAAMDGKRLEELRVLCPSNRCLNFRVDIADKETVKILCEEHEPNLIVNFAAESHVDRSIEDASKFVETNVLGTQNLLDEALKLQRKGKHVRFCQVSTDEVYGPWTPVPVGDSNYYGFSEAAPLNPTNPYSASKAAAEHLVMAAHLTHGLNTIITRGCNTYGSLQAPEKFLPLMIVKAMRDEALPVYGDGQQRREWIHVHDHVSGIRRAIGDGSAGQIYNVGSGSSKTNLEVAEEIISRVGKGGIKHVKDRPGHDKEYKINSDKLCGLSWSPCTLIDEGLPDMINWCLDNEPWLTQNEELLERRGAT